jgi:hypothetical protein
MCSGKSPVFSALNFICPMNLDTLRDALQLEALQRSLFQTALQECAHACTTKHNVPVYICRPLLARGHQAVWHHFNPSILHILLVHLSTYPYILNLKFSCLVSPLPPDPKNRRQNPGAPVCPYFSAHRTPQTVWDIPQKLAPTPQNAWEVLQIGQDGNPRWPT